ncbi:ABC transporter ATP-binding protein [Clostridiales bacterium COT073_COT-073]|nr:ABC transporter ATP-binding protein [Clostridiales bacterium COT073_COT-073]
MPKLELRNISHAFADAPDIQILKDINLYVDEGEIVSIIGPSGGGKTTVFNIVAGLLEPTAGEVWLAGEDITGKSGYVSYMLQKDLLLPFKTVLDNVALPQIIKGKSKKEARTMALPYFREFGLDGTEYKYPQMLSGGMKQRAALLRTYLFEKEMALLDEPFSALDAITKEGIHSWYLDIMKKINLTTLFITHDIEEAILLSDRIYILKGRPAEISESILIDLSRPRDPLSEEVIQMKRKLKAEYLSI